MDTAHEIDLLLKFKRLLKDGIGKRPSNPPSSLASQIERMKGRAEGIFAEVAKLREPPHFSDERSFRLNHPNNPNPFRFLSVEKEYFDDAAEVVIKRLNWAIGVCVLLLITPLKFSCWHGYFGENSVFEEIQGIA